MKSTHKNAAAKAALSAFCVSLLATGCSMTADSSKSTSSATQHDRSAVSPTKLLSPTYDDVIKVAEAEQRTVTDGWFFGELPRLFKSKYLLAPTSVKAQFAMELNSDLIRRGQNMLGKWDSYVSYRDRAEFAKQWWSNPAHSTEFSKQEKRYKVLWLHEALMDASELWWHAFEKKNGEATPSQMILTHDVEQKMVSEYQDKEHQLRSFSDEYARYTD